MRRINLLPPEVGQRRRVRRQASLLVVLGLLVVAGLVAVWVFRNIELGRQEDRVEQAQAEARELEVQIADLRQFADLEELVKQKQQTLASVMAGDVAWSRLLIELSMIIPGDSWITSFSGSAAPSAPPAPGEAAAPPPTLGNLSFSAVTFDFPGVAKWLTRLAELKSLQNIWVPSASKGQIGTREVVNFSSTVDLSAEAASGRFQGGVQP